MEDARCAPAGSGAGGGSGGTVNIKAPALSGNGRIFVDGGGNEVDGGNTRFSAVRWAAGVWW